MQHIQHKQGDGADEIEDDFGESKLADSDQRSHVLMGEFVSLQDFPADFHGLIQAGVKGQGCDVEKNHNRNLKMGVLRKDFSSSVGFIGNGKDTEQQNHQAKAGQQEKQPFDQFRFFHTGNSFHEDYTNAIAGCQYIFIVYQ